MNQTDTYDVYAKGCRPGEVSDNGCVRHGSTIPTVCGTSGLLGLVNGQPLFITDQKINFQPPRPLPAAIATGKRTMG
jgi:hypothetical protein